MNQELERNASPDAKPSGQRYVVSAVACVSLLLAGVGLFVAAAVVQRRDDGSELTPILVISGLAAIVAAVVVAVAFYKNNVTYELMKNLERAEHASGSSLSLFSNPDTMRAAFVAERFAPTRNALRRRFFSLAIDAFVITVVIERTEDVEACIKRTVDRFQELVADDGNRRGRNNILFLFAYMASVTPEAAETARLFASQQVALQKTSPQAFTDVVVPILYDETKQSFSFLDGGKSKIRTYDIGMNFFKRRILKSRG